MTALLARFWTDKTGATAIEYALLATLLSIGLIASIGLISESLNAFFTDAATSFDG